MTTHLTSRSRVSVFFRRALLAAALTVFAAASAVTAAEVVRKQYDLPADSAEQSLKRFAQQSGLEVLFPTQTVSDIRTREVHGEMTAPEALSRMLAGTDLRVVQDETTGAFTVTRVEMPKPREDSTVKLSKVEVSTSKINGLNNQTIFRTDEQGALNYDVISRTDIQRMGATSIEEIFRLVPQTSDYGSTALQGAIVNTNTVGGATYQNSEVKLRGFSSLQTTILINGRRLQRGNLSAGPDLNRIPAAAIERIEILPSSASAIYGGGAIGGAINIILRKDYTGQDLTLKAGTSTGGGGDEYQATYFQGVTLNGGKTQFSFTLDYQHSSPLYLSDRDYLQRALNRYPQNTTQNVNGRSAFETYLLAPFTGMPGTIIINSSTGSLPIPGATGARFAGIPANQNGTALTPSSFTATAGQYNLGGRFGRSMLYRPEDRYAFTSQIEHQIIADKLSVYAEADITYFRSSYSYPQFLTPLSLSATDPLNPFRTGVTPGFVGVPVQVYYDPVDLPDPSLFAERQGARALLGFKGKLNDRWEWSIDGTGEYGRSHSDGRNPTQNLNTFLTASSAGSPTLTERRALYNPLADHVANPVGANIVNYLDFNRQYTYYNNLAQTNLRIVGDVFDLPAGTLTVSPGAEFIWSEYSTRATTTVSPTILSLLSVVGNSDVAAYQSRRTESAFVETTVPLISPKWRPIPIDSAELDFAVRYETTDDSTSKTSPVVGGRVGLTKDIAVRASYSEGFFPPDQANYENPTLNPTAITPFTDPYRGNVTYNYPHIEIGGGNPNLKPERSKAYNYGVVFTPRFLPGFSLTVDYWRIVKRDAIRTTNPSEVVSNPDSYPGRVIRATPTPTDIANGWLGAVTQIDYTPINVGLTQTDGADIKLRYALDTDAGKFTFIDTSTWTNHFYEQILVVNPKIDRVDVATYPLKWRSVGSVYWERNAWTVGLTATYINSYRASSTTPTPTFPTGTGLDGEKIPSALIWDAQLGYKIPYGSRDNGWRKWLSGTEWTLGCRDLFDKEPAFRTDANGGFYSRYEDPRQRFVYLQVKKSL